MATARRRIAAAARILYVMPNSNFESALIYDGECPVCSNYVAFSNARKNIPSLKLLSARQEHNLVKAAWQQGFNLNNEMVLFHNGQWFSGADVMSQLDAFGQPSLTDKLLAVVLGKSASRNSRYAFLVKLRKLLLWILRRSEIKPPKL